MKKIINFPIYFEDLTEVAQHYLIAKFKSIPQYAFPLIVSNAEEIEEEIEADK